MAGGRAVERRWRTGMIALSIGLLLSLTWGFNNLSARKQVEAMLSARYQQNFFEALGYIENVEVLLSKALVSGSPKENIRYLTELWQQAMSAQASLNALPLQQGTLMRTSRFLTQLGDFSFVVGQKAADGQPITDEDWASLHRLHGEVSALGVELTGVAEQSARGTMPWDEMRKRTNLTLNPFSKQVRGKDDVHDLARIERQMQELPTMIYDGPFSDHIGTRAAQGIKGEPVDAFTARSIALQFVPLTDEQRQTFFAEQVTETGEGSPIAAWGIEVHQAGNASSPFILDISKDGGHVLWMLRSRTIGPATHSLEEAIELAEQFLSARDLTDFEVTYPVIESGRAIVPFVLKEAETLIYPDQIKVSVALDTGEIVGFEAMQYYMAHHARTLPDAKLTVEEAKERITADLTVESVRRALIPRSDLSEVLTYEVRGRHGSDLYHVYINALTGNEEQILRIVEKEEAGRLAI